MRGTVLLCDTAAAYSGQVVVNCWLAGDGHFARLAAWPSRAGDAPMLARAWRSGGAGNTCDDDVDGREGRLSMWGGGSGAAGCRELRTRDSYGLD
jgi:hypothetical protein